MTARHGRAVRLLTLTTLFPNAARPRHGIFVANRLQRMCATGRVEATVIAAIPRFPGWYREERDVPAHERIAGLEVHHPRYWQWPRVGMRRQPRALAHAILAQLKRPELAGRTFDVVDAHYFYPDGVAAAIVAHALHLPLVISARGSDVNLIGDIGFARERMLQAARDASALIAVSNALRERMVALGMPRDAIRVLRNGVDMEVFAPVPRALARERLALPRDGLVVAGVGNFVAEKGFDLAVRAVAAAPEMRLLLVGDGPEGARLRALAGKLAPGRVDFRANMPQHELSHVYSAANVLALPSLREGWPNVLLEAIACGTPVAASLVGGVPEIVGPGAPGAALPGRGVSEWTTTLRTLAGAAMPQASVRAYAAAFAWDEIVERQCALYASLVPHAAVTARATARPRTVHGVA